MKNAPRDKKYIQRPREPNPKIVNIATSLILLALVTVVSFLCVYGAIVAMGWR